MNNEFRICDKCKAINVDTLKPRLQEVDPNADIKVGCQNFCGIGMKKSFAIVNNIPVIAETEDELIDKIKEIINN